MSGVVSATGVFSALSAGCVVTVRTAPGDRNALDRFVDRGGFEAAFLTSPEPEASKSVAVSGFFGLTPVSVEASVVAGPVDADVDPVPSLEPLDDGPAPEVDGSAEATPCPVSTAAPIPRATASPPTRPT
jgi:hypothetical protein